jgi:putative acetyltransferase
MAAHAIEVLAFSSAAISILNTLGCQRQFWHKLVSSGGNIVMIIREANLDDAQTIKELHDRSALELCHKDYTSKQLEDWVNFSTIEKYRERLQIHRTFVAVMDGSVVGFVRWNPATNELCSIFVDPDHIRQGIATKLMRRAYEDAVLMGVQNLWLFASLTAVPFYEAEGWQFVEKTMRGWLECVRMEKVLSSVKE